MGKAVLKEVPKAVAATLLFFLLVESLLRVAYVVRNSLVAYVPLPYVIGDDYGPVPPWVDGLRILERDLALIWKNRPNARRRYIDIFSPAETDRERRALLRQFFPSIPASFKGNPVWEISLNSDAFRDAELPRTKRLTAFRIICLGDSWTFGANVGQEQAYPQRLRALLAREFSGADFEVFNLGVLGYSSYQGLKLLRQQAVELSPDLVVIAFAKNDAKVAGYRDKDVQAYRERPSTAKVLAGALERVESYKLLRYLALLLKEKPRSIGDHLKAMADEARNTEPADYEELEPWTRVSPKDYEQNIREMIRLARERGAGVILLRNELWDSPYRAVLEKISTAERVPLVDSGALHAAARKRIEDDLEARLDLQPPLPGRARANGEVEVVFRVFLGARPVPRAVYIAGAHPKLAESVPNKLAMYDDGTHGDQRHGDGVWSYSATFPPGTRVVYVYTNSGKEGRWEGLDVPYVRRFVVEGDERVYRPIESFGKIYMQADSWHTDAAGYELIAKAVLEKLQQDERFQRYVARTVGMAGTR